MGNPADPDGLVAYRVIYRIGSQVDLPAVRHGTKRLLPQRRLWYVGPDAYRLKLRIGLRIFFLASRAFRAL